MLVPAQHHARLVGKQGHAIKAHYQNHGVRVIMPTMASSTTAAASASSTSRDDVHEETRSSLPTVNDHDTLTKTPATTDVMREIVLLVGSTEEQVAIVKRNIEQSVREMVRLPLSFRPYNLYSKTFILSYAFS